MMVLWVPVALLATITSMLYYYLRKLYSYWGDRNIPCDNPALLFGSLDLSSKKGVSQSMRDLYNKSKKERFYGIWFLHRPSLLINDLDLVKDILVKEFMSFQDHGVYYNQKSDPLSAHLFAIEGAKWRNIRIKMTPTFTSGKMKMMFPTLKKCSDQLRDVLKNSTDEVMEVKDLIGRFSTDVISSVAFGIETNSLKNPNAIFREMGRKIFEPTWTSFIRNFLGFAAPDLARLLEVRSVPKKVADFFTNALKETIHYRETNNVKRNDFLQLLIQLMNKGYVEDADAPDKAEADKQPFTFEDALPEAFIFFVGGFETSSTTMQFILYELALNPDIQDRLRKEILEGLAESGGEMTYENVHNMKYMGQVIEETLRKHPPATFLVRVCTKPYRIPDSDFILEKGASVTIPTYGFQMDEQYFPEPERFDPERFSEEQKAKRNHYAYLPFGEGPRVCIGQRFAMMQVRIALVTVLANFRVSVAEGKTPIPLEYDNKQPILTAKGGMFLRISPL
ncbi:UNVERIFIED_CONTAM: hypothetical protein PYX00_007705 [Menopon gallinae]|uniref:Cytochrome P450 n=1 Tax=Menopon gallinae TaxID=328185 RepID=A0AAW2HK29_9NEOP